MFQRHRRSGVLQTDHVTIVAWILFWQAHASDSSQPLSVSDDRLILCKGSNRLSVLLVFLVLIYYNHHTRVTTNPPITSETHTNVAQYWERTQSPRCDGLLAWKFLSSIMWVGSVDKHETKFLIGGRIRDQNTGFGTLELIHCHNRTSLSAIMTVFLPECGIAHLLRHFPFVV